jgi:hypothetical protein
MSPISTYFATQRALGNVAIVAGSLWRVAWDEDLCYFLADDEEDEES